MKTNKNLFEKRIDLKSCKINGGRLASTHTVCTSATHISNCSDTYTQTRDDNGKTIDSNMDFSCGGC
ncbi:hypothetical protein [Pedobacter sp. JY14-1]|uniref:hypothetical protein n=1 Tax=Pedobacter sp. JY14-1 TaxID=3034151 RepID=UPI0023E0BAB7|nr:hypothetical protein [Pedobacter sp. JY14-1]